MISSHFQFCKTEFTAVARTFEDNSGHVLNRKFVHRALSGFRDLVSLEGLLYTSCRQEQMLLSAAS